MSDSEKAANLVSEGLQLHQQATQDAAGHVARTVRVASDAMLAGIAPIQRLVAAFAEALQEQSRRSHEMMRAVLDPLIEGMERAERVFMPVLSYLLNRGWCITNDFPILALPKLYALIRADDHQATDAFMVEFVREQVDATFRALAQRFPDRAAVFADALEAHRGGKYALTIPVLLAQIDGIGCEILGLDRQFFPHKKRLEALEKLSGFTLSDPPKGVTQQMLYALSVQLSIAVPTEVRDKEQTTNPSYGPLNRHDVLHGHETGYGTEENSLRCVLLLRYLLDADKILRVDLPEKRAYIAELERELRSVNPDLPPPAP